MEGKETENEEQKLVLVTDISQLYARPSIEEEDLLEYNNMQVPFKFRHISWPRYNQLVAEALAETETTPDLYERVKQEKILKDMITEIAGSRMNEPTTWIQLDSAFCETLRREIFDGTGEMRVSGALLKNLMPNLNEQIEATSPTKLKRRL